MALSVLNDVGTSFTTFFNGVARALGFTGLLISALAVEAFFVFLFVLLTMFSYERRLSRRIDKLNSWLFANRKITPENIKEFNAIVKKGPKRLQYYWQQYILYREQDPTYYMSLDNLVEKPLKTSSWANNIKNLKIVTLVWSTIVFVFSIALSNDAANSFSALTLCLPAFTLVIGLVATIFMSSRKIYNLDDIYQNYHIFARFISNACVELPSYIDFDLLFDSKDLAKGNPQLREYYESRARKAKEEFENAKKNDVEYVEYDFSDAGVDGSLVLERAMHETEAFINKKTSTLAKIAHVEAEKEALRRNYENVQKDLQRKIQACKENINKLIAQQEATTNRMEVGFIRKQQEQEITKQEGLQAEYDQEETRFALSTEELNQEIEKLRKELEDSKESVQKAMIAEYQTFYGKVLDSAKLQAQRKNEKENAELVKEKQDSDRELMVVQTQIKRLVDENNTLRARLGENVDQNNQDGYYDDQGNYIYKDGSYHDKNGLFHDVDGKIYDMNGTLISEPITEKEIENQLQQDDVVAFGPATKTKSEDESKVTSEGLPQIDGDAKSEEDNAPEKPSGKKRGRPRKPVVEKPYSEPRKRGRPRKEPVEPPKPKRPVGRPRKVATEEQEQTPKKTRPKSVVKKTASKDKGSANKPRNNRKDNVASLEKINDMINAEEDKLSKMKMLIDSEISEAMTSQNEAFVQERDKIMKEIESLQAQAQAVQKEASGQELEKINARLEELIRQVTELNDK